MNYTEMLFNRDERLVDLLNRADSKNLELIEEINNREREIERLNNIIKEVRERVLNENKPLPSAREIIEILDKVGSVKE